MVRINSIAILVVLAVVLAFPSFLFADNTNQNQSQNQAQEAAVKVPGPDPAKPAAVKAEQPAEPEQAVDEPAPADFLQSSETTVIPDADEPAEADEEGPGVEADAAVSELDKDILKNTADGSEHVSKGAIEKNVRMFSGSLRKHFSRYLERSGKYMSLMKDIFRENYLPEDLVFLALIESGFNPKAYSWAKASGPWQFIRGTAKKYGLKVDGWVDERRDPVKSTKAAAAYLKDLYGMFGTWPLAMASYNAGEGNVSRAVNRNGTLDFWELRKTRSLPSETKEYVPKFMAAKMIAQNPGDFGFDAIEYEDPFEFDEVVLNKSTSLETVAKCCDVPESVIKELNPELIRWCTPPNSSSYTLRIPKGTKQTFETNYAELSDDMSPGWREYVVRRGDTLRSISKKFGIPVSVVKQTNSITKLKVGQGLVIPASEYVASVQTEKKFDTSSGSGRGKASAKTYKVKKGDTLSAVARRHGMSVSRLAKLNGLGIKSKLKAGQKLALSSSGVKKARTAHVSKKKRTYRARKGKSSTIKTGKRAVKSEEPA